VSAPAQSVSGPLLTHARFSVRGLVVLVLVTGAGMGWLAKRINVQRS